MENSNIIFTSIDVGTSEKNPELTNIYRLENVTVSKVGFLLILTI